MTLRILNIPVSNDLQDRWRGWLTPAQQPFFMTPEEAAQLDLTVQSRQTLSLSPEERDTFTVWNIAQTASQVALLSAAEFASLPARSQRQLLQLQVRHGRGNVPLGKHFQDLLPALPSGRFLWTPERLTPEILARLIAQEAQLCQREQVPEVVWESIKLLLPRVQELAGTFPAGSGGNCFGAVMAAAGSLGAENEWMQREPFEQFLREQATIGGSDNTSGTVLVWRSVRGVEHAAVTLGQDCQGQNWAFQKPSQCWNTPRQILPVAEIKWLNRVRGWRLERYALSSAAHTASAP